MVRMRPSSTVRVVASPLSPVRRAWRGSWYPVVLFGITAVVLVVVVRLTATFLPIKVVPGVGTPTHRWFEGWDRFDSSWYYSIARNGYFYRGPGVQASVAY